MRKESNKIIQRAKIRKLEEYKEKLKKSYKNQLDKLSD